VSIPILIAAAVFVASGLALYHYPGAPRFGHPEDDSGEDGPDPPAGVPTPSGWQVLFLRPHAADELIQRLERCGVREREVHALGPRVFAVRWRT
jgi:hypothetical protein